MALKETVDFQALSYFIGRGKVPCHPPDVSPYVRMNEDWTQDHEASVVLFGRTLEGRSVTVKVLVLSCLVVRLWNARDAALVTKLVSDQRFPPKTVVRHMHRNDCFHLDSTLEVPSAAKFPFLFIYFQCDRDLYFARAKLMNRNQAFDADDPQKMRMQNIPKFFDTPKSISIDGYTFMVQVVEKAVPLQLQLMAITGIRMSGWVRATGVPIKHLSSSEIQLEVSVLEPWNEAHDLIPLEINANAPIIVYSFDIEVTAPDGVFPTADDPAHAIIAIGSTTYNTQTGEITHTVHGLGRFTDGPGVECYHYESEQELLEGFARDIIKQNPDVVGGYNIDGFDWMYIHQRATRLPPDSVFHYTGKLSSVKIVYSSISSTTKAFGPKLTARYNLPGRINFDLLPFLRRNITAPSYSLGAISTLLLGQTKDDLTIPAMNAHYRSGDPDRVWLVMKYCVQDTFLPIKILEKRLTFVLELELSKVCCVALQDLWQRGQLFRAESQLFLFARARGFVLSTSHLEGGDDDGYVGATVLDAQAGFYLNVATCDFSSLYPSIMIAWNLCPSSLVATDAPRDERIVYKDVDVGDGVIHTFQQSIPGLLPELLRSLLDARRRAKQDQKTAATPELAGIMDGRQLALKCSANSIYGFQGAVTSKYSCTPVAAATTALGRKGIQLCVERIQDGDLRGPNGTKLRVIYGDTDSVFIVFETGGRPWDECKDELFALGQNVTAELNKMFKKPISLELEKIWSVLVLMAKKVYVGMMHGDARDQGKMTAKGYGIGKRDYSTWQRATMKDVIERVIVHNDLPGALKTLALALNNINKAPAADLMLTKKLNDGYKSQNNPQCEVARKSNERAPGFGYKPGDRVEYLVLTGPLPLYTKVEDFKFAVEKGLPIDYDWYANHLLGPFEQFFVCFGPDVMRHVKRIFTTAAGTRYGQVQRIGNLSRFIVGPAAEPTMPKVLPMIKQAPAKRQATVFGTVAQPVAKKQRKPKARTSAQTTPLTLLKQK